MDTLALLWGVIGAVLVVAVGGAAYWWRYRDATKEERLALIRAAVQQLVAHADDRFPAGGDGPQRRAWVMAQLQERYPRIPWPLLSEAVEAAVRRLRTEQGREGGGE